MNDWINQFFSETGQGFQILAAALFTLILVLRLYKAGWAVYQRSAMKKRAYEGFRPLLEQAMDHYQKLTVLCRQHPPGSRERLATVHQLGVVPDFPTYDLTGCGTARAFLSELSRDHQKEIREIARMIEKQQVVVIGTGRENRENLSEEFMTEENLKSNDHLLPGKTKAIVMRIKRLLGEK